MRIEHIEHKKVIYEKEGAKGTKLCSAGPIEAVLLSLEPGAGIEKHALPIPVTFIITAGSGKVSIEESAYPVKKGTTVKCGPSLEREWINTGKEVLEIIVLKQTGAAVDPITFINTSGD